MNTRCYRCGNSFALSREVVEVAVAAAPNDKFYVAYCPRCRQANKIPMQQLKRTLPAGWTAAPAAEAPAPEPQATPEPVAVVAEAQAAPAAKAPRTRAGKAAAAEAPAPEATPAAKEASRSKAKPS